MPFFYFFPSFSSQTRIVCTPKKNKYCFHKGQSYLVKDEDDIEFFRTVDYGYLVPNETSELESPKKKRKSRSETKEKSEESDNKTGETE